MSDESHGITEAQLRALAEQVGCALLGLHWRIVTAESCTGGWIAKVLTDTAGSSQWLECGYVTYSNAAKVRDIGVSPRTLSEHGAVSEATVRDMAGGALRVAGVEVAVSVSGIAGPSGGTMDRAAGTVWFAVAINDVAGVDIACEKRCFGGSRDYVRREAVGHALRMILLRIRERRGG